jgi:hypothetical protein
MPQRKRVFFISDRTGITVEALGSSLLTQFADLDFMRLTLPFIDSIDKAREVVSQVNEAHRESGQRPVVFSSIVDDAVRAEINKADGFVLDVFERFIVPLEGELGTKSLHAVGRTHSVANVKDYNHRIEAINYTLAHDDGVTHRGLEEADIVWWACRAAARRHLPLHGDAVRHQGGQLPVDSRGPGGEPDPAFAPAAEAEGLGPFDHAGAAAPDPQRTPARLALRRARQLPLRGRRGGEAHAPGEHPLPRLHDEIHRGDRDHMLHEAHLVRRVY